MTSAVYVEEAAGWAHKLTLSRVRKPGDYERAMRSLVDGDVDHDQPKVLHATGYSTLWGFRFRMPKRVFADVYFELKHAYEALRSEQFQALETDIAQDQAAGAAEHRLAEAQALVRRVRVERLIARGRAAVSERRARGG